MAAFGCHCALALSPRTTLQMITELIPRARARLIPIAAIMSVALQLSSHSRLRTRIHETLVPAVAPALQQMTRSGKIATLGEVTAAQGPVS
jgi:hypothetical protein